MPANRGQQRVPTNLSVEMRMDIDEARCDDVSLRIDLAIAPGRDAADGCDAVAADPDVGAVPGKARLRAHAGTSHPIPTWM